jgi:hypothetical protein
MGFPLTRDEYLYAVAKETARMSWPGQMAPILKKCAKKTTETYFTSAFLIHRKKIWGDQRISNYDKWHEGCVNELAESLKGKIKSQSRRGAPTDYRAEAVAAKLLNTFMHQLMKYERSRFLWMDLHLPLDQRTFAALRKLAADSIALRYSGMREILAKNPYAVAPKEYKFIQSQLRKLVGELSRANKEIKLTSRIELNVLWADAQRNEGCAD